MTTDCPGHGCLNCTPAAPIPYPSAPRLFGDVLPYEIESSVDGGRVVTSWPTDHYGKRTQKLFEAWLKQHDAEVANAATTYAIEILRGKK